MEGRKPRWHQIPDIFLQETNNCIKICSYGIIQKKWTDYCKIYVYVRFQKVVICKDMEGAKMLMLYVLLLPNAAVGVTLCDKK